LEHLYQFPVDQQWTKINDFLKKEFDGKDDDAKDLNRLLNIILDLQKRGFIEYQYQGKQFGTSEGGKFWNLDMQSY